MNYTIETVLAKKNIITITRKQLWDNFVDSWKDIAWDEFASFKDCDILRQVGSVLCEGLLDYRIRKLFRDGHTYMLMGAAMEHIDLPDSESSVTLVEIVITDGDTKVVVEHGDIQY